MSIITKKVTMTETAWAAVRSALNEMLWENWHPIQQIDVSHALTALAKAETVAVTDTYETIRHDGYDDVDQWLRDAEQQGCRCGVCDRA